MNNNKYNINFFNFNSNNIIKNTDRYRSKFNYNNNGGFLLFDNKDDNNNDSSNTFLLSNNTNDTISTIKEHDHEKKEKDNQDDKKEKTFIKDKKYSNIVNKNTSINTIKEEDNCYIEDITSRLNSNIVGNESFYDIFLDDTEKRNNLYLIITSYSYPAIKKIKKTLNDDISSEVVFFNYEKFGRSYGIKLNKKQFVSLLKKIDYGSLECKKCYKKLVYSDKIKHYSDFLYYDRDNILFFDFN